MPLSETTEIIQRGLSKGNFDGSLKFDCGDDGVIVLQNGAVSRDDADTACTIRITADNLAKLVRGKLNPMAGVMTGKLKVSGDTSVALKLGKLLG